MFIIGLRGVVEIFFYFYFLLIGNFLIFLISISNRSLFFFN